MAIRNVSAKEWGALEGKTKNMPWLVAEYQFTSSFKDPMAASGAWDKVNQKFGCYASNADDWASGMNKVISLLNKLPESASEIDIKRAFGI